MGVYNDFRLQKFTKRRIALSAITFISSLVLLLTLSFRLVRVGSLGFNGWDLLKSLSSIGGVYLYAWITSLLIMISGIVLMLLSIVNALFLSERSLDKANTATFIVVWIEVFAYLVAGILGVFVERWDSTLSFIPLILVAVLTIAYVTVYKNLARDTNEKEESKKSIKEQKQKIDLLASYKKLLDDGVLTQEEFDAKKKEILG